MDLIGIVVPGSCQQSRPELLSCLWVGKHATYNALQNVHRKLMMKLKLQTERAQLECHSRASPFLFIFSVYFFLNCLKIFKQMKNGFLWLELLIVLIK